MYTTLDRLARDGFVHVDDERRQKQYSLTAAGREELGAWWQAGPVDAPPPRDELLLKVLLAVEDGPDHALEVLTRHRTALTALLQTHRRTSRAAADGDLAAVLVSRRPHHPRRGRPALARPLRGPTPAAAAADLPTTDVATTNGVTMADASGLHERRCLRGRAGTRAAHGRQALRRPVSPRCEPSPTCPCRSPPGELVAVMGPSGCGKSTMLHLAGALEDPDAGQVLVGGRDLSTLSATARASLRRTDVGFVFQRLNLVPSLSAHGERDAPPRARGRARP